MGSQGRDDWPEWIDRGGARDQRSAGDRSPEGSPDPRGPDDAGEPPPPGERESAYELLQRGLQLNRARHHAQASVVLERANRLEPRRGSILEALGRAYYNSGQHARAAETFAALLEIDPTAHYAHYALGQSKKQLGELRQARTHLRLAVALSPTSRLYRAALDRLPRPPGEPEPAPGTQSDAPSDG